jgi:hypothetical protein
MTLLVYVADWEFESDGVRFAVGEETSLWMTAEARGARRDDPRYQWISGMARPIRHDFDLHPTVIEIENALVYWRAPAVITGPVDFVGTISRDHVDPPEDLPATRVQVHRVRTAWTTRRQVTPGHWEQTGPTRYADAPDTGNPWEHRANETGVPQPTTRVGDRVKRPAGMPPGTREYVAFEETERLPVGALQDVWAGALLDLEPLGLDET